VAVEGDVCGLGRYAYDAARGFRGGGGRGCGCGGARTGVELVEGLGAKQGAEEVGQDVLAGFVGGGFR